jgi:hypothetical protein
VVKLVVRSDGEHRKLRGFLTIFLLISVLALGSFAAAFESITIPLEVKEPLEILDYPSSLSLYPGENVTFQVTVENHAPITYSMEFDFALNDTDYQAKYITFSSYNYSIVPGTQELPTWLMVSLRAIPANLFLTVNRKTDMPTPSNDDNASLTPTQQLLSAGAKWAAREGKNALYVNWKDNWAAHHLTDGANWEWISEVARNDYNSWAKIALEHAGFEVTLAGDIPDNLGDYDLVVIFASYAVEPQHEPLIRNYVFNGGSVVLFAGDPCYFTADSKAESANTDLTLIQEWFGCSSYVNAGGIATPAFDDPFGSSLSTSDILIKTEIPWCGGVTSLDEDSQPVAFWSSGPVAAFTHEYGDGRVYWQATLAVDYQT